MVPCSDHSDLCSLCFKKELRWECAQRPLGPALGQAGEGRAVGAVGCSTCPVTHTLSPLLDFQVIRYEMGILFCAAVGLLFIAVMPLVGLCFGVCRCCRKCGGEMHQRQRRNGAFLRKCYAASLLALCVLMRRVGPDGRWLGPGGSGMARVLPLSQ